MALAQWIVWVDHHHSSECDWWDEADIVERGKKAYTVTSVGVVVYEDPDTVVLAQESHVTHQGKTEYRNWVAIRKPLISQRVGLGIERGQP